MRQLATVLLVLAAVAFLVGAYSAFSGAHVVGRMPVTYWRGAIGMLLFAITLLLMERRKT